MANEAQEETILSEAEQWELFHRIFCEAASFQGRLAYFLMSMYSCNPQVINSYLGFDIYDYLWANMVYGLSIMIFDRPTLREVAPVNRIAFALLGSLMFNHASMNCFNWVSSLFPDRPNLRVFLGFCCGRVMMVHFLAFLYHMDTRATTPGIVVQRDIAFEQMYSQPEHE